MTKRSGRFLLLAALLAGGVLLVLLVLLARRADDGDGRPRAPAGLRTEATTDGAGPPATLRGTRGPAAPPLPAPGPGSRPAPEDPPAAGAYRIVGSVVDADAAMALALVVRARTLGHGMWPTDDPPVEGRAREDGTFDLDVSALDPAALSSPIVRLEVDHPDHVVAKQPVDLSPGPGVYEVEVRLTRGAVVAGRVVDENGAPLAGARLALHAMGRNGPEEEERDDHPLLAPSGMFQPLDADTSSQDGAFRLRMPTAGRFLVTAGIAGRLPDAVVVDLALGRTKDVRALILKPGETLAGEVRLLGHPLDGADIYAHGLDPGYALDVNHTSILWHEGRVRPEGAMATANAEGRFRLEGLAPGTYRLGVMGGPTLLLHPSTRTVGPTEVTVPGPDVVLELVGRTLEIVVTCEGEPLDGVGVSVQVGGAFMMAVTKEGRARIVVDPRSATALHIDEASYGPRVVQVAPGPAATLHTERIELVREAPGPRLVVRLLGEAARGLSQAGFTWTRLDGTPSAGGGRPPRAPLPAPPGPPAPEPANGLPLSPVPVPAASIQPGGRLMATVEEGRCALTELGAGRHRLTLRPNGNWTGVTGSGYLRDVEAVVSLLDGRTTEIEMEVRRGGRLRIAARDADGAFVRARCRILDPRGEPVAARFLTVKEGISMYGPKELGHLSASTVDPPLAPGTHTVELEAPGYEPWTCTVEIEVEKTAEVDVRLVPTR